MSSYIAFDLGNVLMEIDFGPFEEAWKKCDFSDGNWRYFLDGLHRKQDIDLTSVDRSLEEKFALFERLWPEKKRLLLDSWSEVVRPHAGMIQMLQWLKGLPVKVALLSNIGSEHADLIRGRWGDIFKGCDLHLSYEVGARKPSKLYYQSFLMENPEYRGCVYVDDLRDNLRMGERMGFRSVYFNLDEWKECGEDRKREWLCEFLGEVVSVNKGSDILGEFLI